MYIKLKIGLYVFDGKIFRSTTFLNGIRDSKLNVTIFLYFLQIKFLY